MPHWCHINNWCTPHLADIFIVVTNTVFFLSQQFTDNITGAWNGNFKAIDEIIKSDNHLDSDEKRDLIAELQFENSSLVTSIFLVSVAWFGREGGGGNGKHYCTLHIHWIEVLFVFLVIERHKLNSKATLSDQFSAPLRLNCKSVP